MNNFILIQKLTGSRSFGPEKSLVRGISFNAETGEKEQLKSFWESSSWAKLEKGRGRALERANSFIGSKSSSTSQSEGAIVVVDPFSTGTHLAAAVCEAGIKCARYIYHIYQSFLQISDN